jgi:hypothetical protein
VEANRTLSYPQFAVTVESSRKYMADLVMANKTTITDTQFAVLVEFAGNH